MYVTCKENFVGVTVVVVACFTAVPRPSSHNGRLW